MSERTFNIDPCWFAQQMQLARTARPYGGARIRKDEERLLVGFVDGVLILAFPNFQASTASAGGAELWFSLNPHRFGKLVSTFSYPVRVTVGTASIVLDRFQQTHAALKLRLGKHDRELAALAERIDEVTAEHCYQRLVTDRLRQQRIAEKIRWHRAETAVNTTPLVEHIRENSLIVYRRPEGQADAEPSRAIVDKKLIIGRMVSLCCHDFRGAEITVDPRWVTHVGC